MVGVVGVVEHFLTKRRTKQDENTHGTAGICSTTPTTPTKAAGSTVPARQRNGSFQPPCNTGTKRREFPGV